VSSCYGLIEAEKKSFPVRLMCRMLRVRGAATTPGETGHLRKKPSGCRSHLEDSGGPRTQSPHVWISQGSRRVEGTRESLWPQTG
jgi:hypothetical protein